MAFFPNLSALTDGADGAAEVMKHVPMEFTKLTIKCVITMTKEETKTSPRSWDYRPYVTVRTSYNDELLMAYLKEGGFDDGYINATIGVIDDASKRLTHATASRVKAILEAHVQFAYPHSSIDVPMLDPENLESSPFFYTPSPIYPGQEHVFGSDVFIDYDVNGPLHVDHRTASLGMVHMARFAPATALQNGFSDAWAAIGTEFRNLYDASLQANINPPVSTLQHPGRGATPRDSWTTAISNAHYFTPTTSRTPEGAPEHWKETWKQTHAFSTILDRTNRAKVERYLQMADPESAP